MRLATMVLSALLLGVTNVAGQDANLNIFLFERSYAALGTPKTTGAPDYHTGIAEPLLAEAQLGVHLPLLGGLSRQTLLGGGGRAFSLFLTPQFRLRALDVASGPVRSISFMPKFTLQHLWALGEGSGPQIGSRHVLAVNGVVGHHSNGGSTCVFTDETHDAEGNCVSSLDPIPPASQREIRVNDGNFSTNYIEIGGGYRIGYLGYDGRYYNWKRLLDVAVSYQHHHNWIGFPVPGGAVDAFADLYGPHRIRVDLMGFSRDVLGLDLRARLRLDGFRAPEERFDGASNHSLESEFSVSLPSCPCLPEFLRLGVRYSRGMDYYNTQFVRDIEFVQFVVAIDPWTPRVWG